MYRKTTFVLQLIYVSFSLKVMYYSNTVDSCAVNEITMCRNVQHFYLIISRLHMHMVALVQWISSKRTHVDISVYTVLAEALVYGPLLISINPFC